LCCAAPSLTAELLVELPLAYYVPPVSRIAGELRVSLDLEQLRMTDGGLCSLRLRRPCEWEGALYESVTAVAPLPLVSGALSPHRAAAAARGFCRQLTLLVCGHTGWACGFQ
jgi:hypothetical protein